MDCPLLGVSTAGSPGALFITVFGTTVKRASCGVRRLLRSGEVPITLESVYCAGGGCWSLLSLPIENLGTS